MDLVWWSFYRDPNTKTGLLATYSEGARGPFEAQGVVFSSFGTQRCRFTGREQSDNWNYRQQPDTTLGSTRPFLTCFNLLFPHYQVWRVMAGKLSCCEQQVSLAKRSCWKLGLEKVPQIRTRSIFIFIFLSFFLESHRERHSPYSFVALSSAFTSPEVGFFIQVWTKAPNFLCIFFSTVTGWCYGSGLCFSGTLKQNMTRTVCVYIPFLEVFCTKW